MHVVEQDEGGGGDGADALGELVRLDRDRDLFCGWGWVRSAQQRTLRQVTVPAGGASEGWSGPGAGSQACCGVRSGSLSRLAARVAGDAVRRGQVQAERRMKARSSSSSPMERP